MVCQQHLWSKGCNGVTHDVTTHVQPTPGLKTWIINVPVIQLTVHCSFVGLLMYQMIDGRHLVQPALYFHEEVTSMELVYSVVELT